MKTLHVGKLLIMAGLACIPAFTQAQTASSLPDTGHTTTISAIVSESAVVHEQSTVNIPSTITFHVTNARGSASATVALSFTNMITETAHQQLHISVQANSAAFTPPLPGATTWNADAVSWSAGNWTNATGSAGTLSSSAYGLVALGAANATSLSVAKLPLTLKTNSSITRAGSHSLVVTWKIDSI